MKSGDIMAYKYIILDFGKVIAGPPTKYWEITPKFLELVDVNKLDKEKYSQLKKAERNIPKKILTLEEEYKMHLDYYDYILSNINYPNYTKSISEKIAYDRTYNYDKYILYDNIDEELKSLKEKYKLIVLSDNWPSGIEYLKHHNLFDYFEKVYVSSIYGVEKKDIVFFDYPINDFNIRPGEALFIDDNETNLDIAKEKGLDVLLMDRTKEIKESKYRIITDLSNI